MFLAIIIIVFSLLLLSLSLSLLPSSSFASSFTSSNHSFYPSAFAFIPGLDAATTVTVTADQDSSSRSTTDYDEQASINNSTNTLRTYTNTAFNLTLQYPATWGIMEFKTNPMTEVQRSSPIAVILSPLEKESDNFQEKMLMSVQNLLPGTITLQDYTNSTLSSYRNQSDTIKILESAPTTLAGQPAHRIVYTDDGVKGIKLKKIQVWTVFDNSKAYVITFGSEESKYNDYLSDVQNILSSFKITSGSSRDNSSQEQRNHLLTFDDPLFGIKLEYPSSWTKTQPGLPLDNRTFAFIVSFIAPRPAVSISENENENNSSFNSSRATINVGINDVARFISGKTTSPSSFNNNNTSNTGNRNVTLAEYSSKQMEHIRQIGAQLRSSIPITMAGLPGQQVYYLVDKRLLIIQAWTLNEGKAYHIVLSANDPDDFMANLPVFHNIVRSMELNFNSSKTNRAG